jgi:hypothetical protein
MGAQLGTALGVAGPGSVLAVTIESSVARHRPGVGRRRDPRRLTALTLVARNRRVGREPRTEWRTQATEISIHKAAGR